MKRNYWIAGLLFAVPYLLSTNPYFDEAKLVIECEKIYSDDIDRTRLFEKGRRMYSGDTNETHRMFIGRIVNMWIKE